MMRNLRARLGTLAAIWTFIWPRLKPYLGRAVLGTCLSVVAAVFGVLSTLALASLLEVLKGGGSPATAGPVGAEVLFDLNTMGQYVLGWLWGVLGRTHEPAAVTRVVCGLTVVTIVLAVVFSLASRWLWLTVRIGSGRRMQVDLFERLLQLPMRFHVHQKLGSLISRLHIDVQGVAHIIPILCDTLIRSPLMLLAFAWLLIRTSPSLTLVTLAAAALYLAGTVYFGRLTRRLTVAFSRTSADLISVAQQALLSIRVVKAFCAEPREVQRLRDEADDLTRTELRSHLFEKELPDAVHRVLGILTLGLVGLEASSLVVRGVLSQQGMLLFLWATTGMLYSASMCGKAIIGLYVLSASASRVLELWRVPVAITDGIETASGFHESLVLQELQFGYGTRFALGPVSLRIRKGEVVGIVGPSGAGKSTLADLLLRLYEPAVGRIALDGRDIRQFTTRSYRRLFGVVSQECLLVNDTVRNNIAYGDPALTEEDIVRAAQIANAHGFISELPQGYDTLVGDRGVRLSGGQRQRIAIARAIVHRPVFLIFDEATSSLDNESERLVQQAIGRVIQQCTAVIIAHRLTTLQMATRILVMDQGQVVQEGSHAELLGRPGLYRRLYESQLADGEPMVEEAGQVEP